MIKVKIADINIDIKTDKDLSTFFNNYLRNDNEKSDITLTDNNDKYHLDILDELASNLAYFKGFLMHGASISYKNKGYVFIAPPGTGKSTHIKLWLKHLKDVKVINGDKPIIRIIKNNINIYGNPWNGKEGLGNNISLPLDSIILIQRSNINKMYEIDKKDYIQEIFKQVYLPDNNLLNETFDLLNYVFENTKLYKLECTKDDEAFYTSYKTLLGVDYESK